MNRFLLSLILAPLSSSCSDSESLQTVGSYKFSVPPEHLADVNIPWLPSGQTVGFRFYLSPEAEDKRLVSVYRRSDACKRTVHPAPDGLAEVCEDIFEDSPYSGIRETIKIVKEEDLLWDYVVPFEDRVIVASCFPASPSSRSEAHCSARGTYRELVFSIYTSEEDVDRLPDLFREIKSRLYDWDNANAR